MSDTAQPKENRVNNSIEDDIIFTKTEIEAEFPGGNSAWLKYVQSNLSLNINSENQIPKGKYVVVIRFIVSKDGTISNLASETKHGYGMEEEVMRLIKNSPKWTLAMQNGNIVNAYRRQPFTFIL